jgi:acetoin:2,6-dichlorophenolindophenol oxidoreductase subunit beta
MPWTRLVADAMAEPSPDAGGGRRITYGQALREAHIQAMAADPRVFVMGEGVDDPGGVFGSTKGLAERFGPRRVLDLPIAENGCQGFALGAAITGMRPIVVHMRCDFLFMAMDQIVNHTAKWRTMTGGRQQAPLVIRAIVGRGWGSAAQHSQSPHGLLAGVPGLRVVMPAFPEDAKGLLLSAVADPDPVLCLEHRWLYAREGDVPEAVYFTPIGHGRLARPGTDVTVAAVSLDVFEALKAAETVAGQGIDAEVLDMRSVKPWDADLLAQSLVKTGRLVVVDSGQAMAGFGAELAAWAACEGFGLLRAPVVRVGMPDRPTPAAPALEAAHYPGPRAIAAAIATAVGEVLRD